MLVAAIVFTAIYSIGQLSVLGSFTRSVRFATLLLAVGVGAYGSGMAAVVLQFTYTRVVALLVDDRMADIVHTAGYTVDPFLEELCKVLPLVVGALWARSRWQWGYTDYVLVGAAIGAGFGLFEAVLRIGNLAEHQVVSIPGGWWVLDNFTRYTVLTPRAVVGDWLPAPTSSENVFFGGAVAPQFWHLIWGAVNGLGVAVMLRGRRTWRLVGLGLLVFTGADHAALNYDLLVADDQTFGGFLAAPFRLLAPTRNWWPLVALVAAIAFDRRMLSERLSGHHDIRLANERSSAASEIVALARFAVVGLPWALCACIRFVLVRRAALYGADHDRGLLASVAEVRSLVERCGVAEVRPWAGFRALRRRLPEGPTVPGTSDPSWLARYWQIALWGLLMLPAATYYGIGTTPGAVGVQRMMSGRWATIGLTAVAVGGLVWLLLQLRTVVHAAPVARTLPGSEEATKLAFRFWVGVGGLVLGGVSLFALGRGASADEPVLRYLHVIDALGALLVIAGVGLLLLAFVYFPPLAVITLVGGGTILVPTVGGGFVTVAGAGALLGWSGVALHQAAGNAGASSEVYASRDGAGRGDPHGDDGRAIDKAQAQIAELEAELAELVRTQGSKRAKARLKAKIQTIRQQAEAQAKGGTHGRRERGQQR